MTACCGKSRTREQIAEEQAVRNSRDAPASDLVLEKLHALLDDLGVEIESHRQILSNQLAACMFSEMGFV